MNDKKHKQQCGLKKSLRAPQKGRAKELFSDFGIAPLLSVSCQIEDTFPFSSRAPARPASTGRRLCILPGPQPAAKLRGCTVSPDTFPSLRAMLERGSEKQNESRVHTRSSCSQADSCSLLFTISNSRLPPTLVPHPVTHLVLHFALFSCHV